MSDNFIWWAGAVHLALYAIVGGFILLTIATVKAHMFFQVMGRIIHWHHARGRWERRHRDGLTDAEWANGEPRP